MEKPKIQAQNTFRVRQEKLFSTEFVFDMSCCRLQGMFSESICCQLPNDSKMEFKICLCGSPKLFVLTFLILVIVKRHFLPPQLSVVE